MLSNLSNLYNLSNDNNEYIIDIHDNLTIEDNITTEDRFTSWQKMMRINEWEIKNATFEYFKLRQLKQLSPV